MSRDTAVLIDARKPNVPHALTIEDDPAFGRTLQRVLQQQGYGVDLAPTLDDARRRMAAREYDLVLLDEQLPDGGGLGLLETLVAQPNRPVVIMVTGVERLSVAIEAIQRGAYDYFQKPPDLDELIAVIERAQRERELRDQIVPRSREPSAGHPKASVDQLVKGASPQMLELLKQVARVAPTQANVLITGESGTGKELLSRTIHEVGGREQRPFVAVNCAALSPTLIESELFGHVRGAFTGATRDRPGRFELAGEGTLLLDEIGELELELQGKLLRVIEERTFERVGDTRSRPFEARLLCATHRDLRQDVQEGRFREDLFFRISVIELHLPPLRERRDDIGVIAKHLLRQVARQLDKPNLVLSEAALRTLSEHDWPGNVRELRNVIERSAIMALDLITPEHVGQATAGGSTARTSRSSAAPKAPSAPRTLAEMEREHIQRTLDQLGWVKKAAAEALGISRPTLDRKIQVYGLRRPDEE